MSAYVAYRVHAGVAVGLCDPVASAEEDALPRIGLALSRAYLPDAAMSDLVVLARSGRQ